MRVLVIMSRTGEEFLTGGHPFAATTPLLFNILIDAGFDVELSTNLERLKGPDLGGFDAVVFHGIHDVRDQVALDSLIHFVRVDRKGLVVIHIASASYAQYNVRPLDGWLELIGSVWFYAPETNHARSFHPEPPRQVRIEVEDSGHPIMAGLPASFVLAREELYQNLLQAPFGNTGHVLASGTDERLDAPEPVALALPTDPETPEGRVFHLTLGHFVSTYENPDFQRMIVQGVRWVTG